MRGSGVLPVSIAAIAIALSIHSATADEPRSRRNVPAWEYRVERFANLAAVEAACVDLGKSGWELVCIHEGAGVFKRPEKPARKRNARKERASASSSDSDADDSGASAVEEIVRAKEFQLIDSDGKIRAKLRMLDPLGPLLVFYDKTGKLRLSMGTGDHGGGFNRTNVVFWNGTDDPRGSVGLDDLADDAEDTVGLRLNGPGDEGDLRFRMKGDAADVALEPTEDAATRPGDGRVTPPSAGPDPAEGGVARP